MPRPPLTIALLAACSLTLATAASGFAAKGDSLPYRGLSDQDRGIKLIVDGRGRVKRGAFSAVTECSGRYEAVHRRVLLPGAARPLAPGQVP